MKIDKAPQKPSPPRTYHSKPKSGRHSRYGHGSEDKGLLGNPFMTLAEYQEINRNCLRIFIRHHANHLPRVFALNSIMDQKREAQ